MQFRDRRPNELWTLKWLGGNFTSRNNFILNNMNEGKATGAIFLDLKKAFDTINHALLIKKLEKIYGISGNSIKWFISYLNERSQAVNVSSSLSDSDIGIPQGPLLFIIFVNSLPYCVNCKTIMYADDTTLMCSSNDASVLQSQLNDNLSKIASWFNENHLTLNNKKNKLTVFGTRHILDKFDNVNAMYNGDFIEKVESFKYLGVTFDPLLSWSEHVNHISSKISQQFYLPNDILKG